MNRSTLSVGSYAIIPRGLNPKVKAVCLVTGYYCINAVPIVCGMKYAKQLRILTTLYY